MDPNDIITEEQCVKVLEKYIGKKNCRIKCHTVNPLQSQLDGMLSEQYILKIHYKEGNNENVAQFFLKTLCKRNPVMYNIARSIYAYEKESFYYETLIPMLKLRAHNTSHIAKSYFSEPYIIVLEDLSLRSFKGLSKTEPLDLQHCKKGLETLAKFHGKPIIYELEEINFTEGGYQFDVQFSDILEDKVFCEEENGATKFMQCSIEAIFKLIDIIPENGVNKTEFKETVQAALESIPMKMSSSEFTRTILHGDLWSNNFLYQYENENNEITDCVLIDFQTLKHGPPAMDLLQFLFTNTRKEFRDLHQTELITHYYSSLSSLFEGRGLELAEQISDEQFQKSLKVYAVPAKITAVVDRSITFVSDEDHLKAMKNEEDFEKYLFEDRGKYVVEAFNRNEGFRELMTEDIIELRDMLFSK